MTAVGVSATVVSRSYLWLSKWHGCNPKVIEGLFGILPQYYIFPNELGDWLSAAKGDRKIAVPQFFNMIPQLYFCSDLSPLPNSLPPIFLPWKRSAESCCTSNGSAGQSRGSWGCQCGPVLPDDRLRHPPCCDLRFSASPPGRCCRSLGRPAAARRSSCPGSEWWRAAWSGGWCWYLRGYASQQAFWVKKILRGLRIKRYERNSSAGGSRETNIKRKRLRVPV